MPVHSAATFHSPELSEMHQGIIYAAVPVIDNCMQINNQRPFDQKPLLRIVKDELGVCVGRIDATPLQAEINHREEPFENEHFEQRLTQKKVFTRSLPSITFVKADLSLDEHVWMALEDPSNKHPKRLTHFAEIIGSVSAEKQRRSKNHSLEVPALILHPTKGGTYSQSVT